MSYQDVKDRLYHGYRKVANNTYLQLVPIVEEDGSTIEAVLMTLRSHTVVAFYPTYLELYSAGWYTDTTKSMLNLALDLAGIHGYTVWQSNYQWYYGYLLSGIEFKDGMKLSYTGEVL